jgi:sulfur transfer complex TusBCD TusB component (DsrH family)
MLRFFRQLRQRLLTQNRISKYLLYAIGEIVLVVIGILIALQVNNYSETIKEREIYVSYLLRLKEDFLELQETVKLKKQFEAELIELAEYQLEVLTGKETNPDILKLAISIEYTASVNRYEILSPTYLELNSTGRLALIENDDIKDFLSGYYKYLQTRKDQKAEWDPWVHHYRSLVRAILDPEDRSFIDFEFGNANADLESPTWKKYTLKSKDKNVVNELLKVPNLTGLLQDILTARRITYSYLDFEFHISNDFLLLIQSEIDRLKGSQ